MQTTGTYWFISRNILYYYYLTLYDSVLLMLLLLRKYIPHIDFGCVFLFLSQRCVQSINTPLDNSRMVARQRFCEGLDIIF
jgi:hypothetical protein